MILDANKGYLRAGFDEDSGELRLYDSAGNSLTGEGGLALSKTDPTTGQTVIVGPGGNAAIAKPSIRIGLLGDSRQESYITDNLSAVIVTKLAKQAFGYAERVSGVAMEIVAESASNGYSTTQAFNELLPELLANADVDMVIEWVGVNDIYTLGRSGATIFAEKQKIWAACKAAGKKVGTVLEPPAGGTAFTAPMLTALAELNALVRENAALVDKVFDFYSPMLNPASITVQGAPEFYEDAAAPHIHNNTLGGSVCGEIVVAWARDNFAPVEKQVLAQSDYTVTSTTRNKNTNSMLLGGGGTVNANFSLPAAWAASQAVSAGDVRSNSATNSLVYEALDTGTTGATEPTHAAGIVSVGGIRWKWVGWSQLPAGVSTSRILGTGAAIVFSVPAYRRDGLPRPGRAVRVIATSGGTNDVFSISMSTPNAVAALGDRYQVRCAAYVHPDSVSIKSPSLRMSTTMNVGSPQTYERFDNQADGGAFRGPVGKYYDLKTPVLEVAGTLSSALGTQFWVNCFRAGRSVVDFMAPSLDKLN